MPERTSAAVRGARGQEKKRLADLLDRAIELDGAEMGTLQALDGDVLRIVAHRGFGREFIRFFAEVRAFDGSVCGRAAGSSGIVIVPDVEHDEAFAAYRPVARREGMRSVKSCAILCPGGRLLGVVSTHVRRARWDWDKHALDDLLPEFAAVFKEK